MKISLWAAAAFLVAGISSVSRADIAFSWLRTPNANLPGYDSVYIFATNDGAGIYGVSTGIFSIDMTITDMTGNGLVMGLYRTSVGAGPTTYRGDPDGSMMGSNREAVAGNTYPVYGTTVYPEDVGQTGTELYSWIGNGGGGTRTGTIGWSLYWSSPEPTTASSIAFSGFGTMLSSFSVQGLWLGEPLDASAESGVGRHIAGLNRNGQVVTGTGALMAVAVVPCSAEIEYHGRVAGQGYQTFQSFSGTTNRPLIEPEPTSLGVLALGGMILLVRRCKHNPARRRSVGEPS